MVEQIADAYRLMGMIHLSLENEQEALDNLDHCYELEPDSTTGLECRNLAEGIEVPEPEESD